MTEGASSVTKHMTSIFMNGIANIKKTLYERPNDSKFYCLVSKKAIKLLKDQNAKTNSALKADVLKALHEDVIINTHEDELRTILCLLGPLASPKPGVISDLYEPVEVNSVSGLTNMLSNDEIPIIYRKLKYSPTTGFDMVEPNFHVIAYDLDYCLFANRRIEN